MPAQRLNIDTHRPYEGSIEEINGLLPAEDQIFSFDELNTIGAVVENHAVLIDQQASQIEDHAELIDQQASQIEDHAELIDQQASQVADLVDTDAGIKGHAAAGETLGTLRDSITMLNTTLANSIEEVRYSLNLIGIFQVVSNVYATDPYVIRIVTLGAKGGTPPYSAWRVHLQFYHPDQAGRTLTIQGDVLSAAPTSITDTSGLVTLTKTGVFYGADGTPIGGPDYDRGDTVKAVSGTMGYLDIVSSVADLYGDIGISVSVADTTTEIATANL